ESLRGRDSSLRCESSCSESAGSCNSARAPLARALRQALVVTTCSPVTTSSGGAPAATDAPRERNPAVPDAVTRAAASISCTAPGPQGAVHPVGRTRWDRGQREPGAPASRSHLGTAVGLAPQRSVSLPGKNAGERIGRRGRAGHVAIVVTGPVGGQGLVPNRGQ